MTSDGSARRVRRQVLRERAKKAFLVLSSLLAVALLLGALAAAGVVRIPLEGIPLSDDLAWVLGITGAERLRVLGYDGRGITVCLVDTGVDPIHPDLAGARIVAWTDLVNHEPLPYDDGGHGTAMAGLLVGRGRVQGLAPGVDLISVKALRANGTGSSETVGRAIRFCMDPNGDGDLGDGADIVSLSLGAQRTPFTTNAAALAAREATNRGILVVASAGNDGREDDGDVGTPASEPLVLAVGSVNHRLEIAAFSSRGNNSPLADPPRVDPHRKPEFILPGVGIVTTASGASYTAMTGTSVSAALLAGLLAVLLDALPQYRKAGAWGVEAVKTALMATAQPLEGQTVPHDDRYGYGLVQLDEAYLRLREAAGGP